VLDRAGTWAGNVWKELFGCWCGAELLGGVGELQGALVLGPKWGHG
jgi:hypothetical protein